MLLKKDFIVNLLKMKKYKGKTSTHFQDNKILKKGSQCVCLPVIFIDSVFRAGKNYYPQIFLEDCNYVIKEEAILRT